MSATGKTGIGLAVIAALVLVTFGVVAAAGRPSGRPVDKPHLVSMQESTQAMQQAGEALHWNGLSMRGVGQNMVDHARIMAEEVEVMIERHGLQGQAGDDLRRAVQVMREVGGHLMQNGQEMMDYAHRIRRSMGMR
jgi:hypothetical protein